ncbi:MAG: MFS transporter, partial [Actinomycetales bacterium]
DGRADGLAGLVAAAETIGSAVGSPWRGRLLDSVGLRRALVPSLVAVVVVYPLMAVATFWWLVPLAFLAGIFLVPIYALVRLSLAVLVPEEERRTAFALDAVVAEASFIIGPAAGGALVVLVSPEVAITAVGLCIAAAASVFWYTDPPIRS